MSVDSKDNNSSSQSECDRAMLLRIAHFDRTCASLAPVASPVETLQRTLLREQRRRRRCSTQRNISAYITEVQCDGMTASWRQKMARWMFETGAAFGMAKDTVGCAVIYMDEYLSVHSVTKPTLQMLALVALSMASKMHETQPISLDEMKVLSENKFSSAELWRMEAQIAAVMDWNLDPLSPFTLARDLTAALALECCDALVDAVMQLLQDVTEDVGSLRYRSSSIAITAAFVAAKALDLDVKHMLAAVLRSLDVSSADLVACFHFVVALHLRKTSSSSTDVKDVGGVLIASSPCSVDHDLRDELRSPVWTVEFCTLLHQPRRLDNQSSSGDNTERRPQTKRQRAV